MFCWSGFDWFGIALATKVVSTSGYDPEAFRRGMDCLDLLGFGCQRERYQGCLQKLRCLAAIGPWSDPALAAARYELHALLPL